MSRRRDTIAASSVRRSTSPAQRAPARPRARVPQPRRRLRRFTKWALSLGALVTALAFGAQWILHRPYFCVQHVAFVGLRHETSTAALAASGLGSHPTMISLNEVSVAKGLSVFPWINSVSVTKHWPNSVVVTVHESTAVAVAFTGKKVLDFVAASGRALGPAPTTASLPTLEYLHPTSPSWPYAKAGRAAAYVASRLPKAFDTQVSVVTADAKGDVTIKLTTPVTFVLGPPTNLHAKFVAIASVIAHSTLVPGDVVDVTVPDELAVTPPSSK